MKKIFLIIALLVSFSVRAEDEGRQECPATARECAQIVFDEIVDSVEDEILEVYEILRIVADVRFCISCGYTRVEILRDVFNIACENNAPEVAEKVLHSIEHLEASILKKYPYLSSITSLITGGISSMVALYFWGYIKQIPFLHKSESFDTIRSANHSQPSLKAMAGTAG